MKKFAQLLATVSITLAAACAQAVPMLIDFQGVAPARDQFAVGNNYQENGYQLHNGANSSDAAIIGQVSQNTSGSDYYTWNSQSSNQVFLTNIGGFNFSLDSLDVGSKSGRSTANFDIIGNYASGGSITYDVRNANAFTPLILTGFNALSSVQFEYISGDFGAIDNLAVNVPEPGSIALLSLGLLGLGAMRRRKA